MLVCLRCFVFAFVKSCLEEEGESANVVWKVWGSFDLQERNDFDQMIMKIKYDRELWKIVKRRVENEVNWVWKEVSGEGEQESEEWKKAGGEKRNGGVVLG